MVSVQVNNRIRRMVIFVYVRAHALMCRYLGFVYTNKDKYIMSMLCFNGGMVGRFVLYISGEGGSVFKQAVEGLGG